MTDYIENSTTETPPEESETERRERLRKEILLGFASAINRASRENESNMPDFILAEFLESCLGVLETAVKKSDEWHSRDFTPDDVVDMKHAAEADEAIAADAKFSPRCGVTATLIDGPVPYEVRCVKEEGHTDEHKDADGFIIGRPHPYKAYLKPSDTISRITLHVESRWRHSELVLTLNRLSPEEREERIGVQEMPMPLYQLCRVMASVQDSMERLLTLGAEQYTREQILEFDF